MANYEAVIVSEIFLVKKDDIDDVRRAVAYFEQSFVNENGEAFIGSYDQTLSDDLRVLIDKRTKKVISTFDAGYEDKKDIIEVHCDIIEDFLSQANIKSEDEYDEDDFEEVDFFEYIQSVLEHTDKPNYCFIKEVGHEKLRYAVGCGVLVTKTDIKWFDLDRLVMDFLDMKG